MAGHKRGRHAPAFILIILAMGPNHGLGILNKMNELVPDNRMDTAGIYRVLKALEGEECIEACWCNSDSGPKKKVYSLTEKGRESLDSYKADIEKSIERLNTFLSLYGDYR